ncbi:hypothetical protein B0O99DRAFT_689420 [Bisporella sp. PMI_857]|nr:hypothetical protein B0O99DRAFT_689420 [Bisporella sp. PMI_857]
MVSFAYIITAGLLAVAQAYPASSPSTLAKRIGDPDDCYSICALACMASEGPLNRACMAACYTGCVAAVEAGDPIGSVDITNGSVAVANGSVIFEAEH